MSHEEKEKIDVLLGKFEEFAEDTKTELATIKRGIYGDPANQVPGLLERQAEDERRLSAIEKRQTKFFIWGGVILAALQVAWNFVKDKLL